MAVVLCTGVDLALSKTRKMILERAGHSVITASSADEIRRACEQTAFDIAVIGQAVSRTYKRQTLDVIHESCSSAKVLELYTLASGRELADADDWLQVPTEVPPDLADRVTQLASRT